MNPPNRYIPEPIIFDILKRLPVKPLLAFRSVSKLWKTTIDSPDFIKSHYNFAIQKNKFQLLLSDDPEEGGLISEKLFSINYQNYSEATEMVDYPYKGLKMCVSGSCNGLVFLRSHDFDLIWNPSTREFKKLPKEFVMANNISASMQTGFGYSLLLDDYKVVKLKQFYNQDEEYVGAEVRLYTLSTNSCKTIKGPGFDLGNKLYSILTTNSDPHWLASDSQSDPTSIAGFDLEREIFHRVPNPRGINEVCTAGFLGEHLCILDGRPDASADIWVMKIYGVQDSWERLFSIPYSLVTEDPTYLWVLFPTQGNKVMLRTYNQFILYDPELDESRPLPLSIFPDEKVELSDYHLTTYIGSLVSLRSRTSVDPLMPVTEPIEKNGEEGGDDMLVQNDAEA